MTEDDAWLLCCMMTEDEAWLLCCARVLLAMQDLQRRLDLSKLEAETFASQSKGKDDKILDLEARWGRGGAWAWRPGGAVGDHGPGGHVACPA